MKPKEARAKLLAQHARIRELCGMIEKAAARVRAGEAATPQLSAAVALLHEALLEHNATEERLLEPMLRLADASVGPARVGRMVEEHGAEHMLFRQRLQAND